MAKFPARLRRLEKPRSREPSQPALSYEHIENFTKDSEARRDLGNRAHMKRPPDELQNIFPSSSNIYNMKHYISCNSFSAKETICSSFPVGENVYSLFITMAFVTDVLEFQAFLDVCSSTREWEIFYLALINWIYKQNTHTYTVEPKTLYFNFVWLLQNRFLHSISRKWKIV